MMIVAGEASGDMHGAALAAELLRRRPDLEILGMGGKAMQEAGVDIVAPLSPVVGLVEIIADLGGILRSLLQLKKILLTRRPGLLVLIDYPDFNLMLARYARRLGIRIMYYVSPQVWAWRKGRLSKIASLVDAMAVILPFEKQLYEDRGLKTVYVGHPLIEKLKTHVSGVEELRKGLGLKGKERVLAVFPGSRNGEVRNHSGIVEQTLKLIQNEGDGIKVLVPVAPTLNAESRRRLDTLKEYGAMLVEGRSWDVLGLADAALIASGTASLESALLGVPTVVFYRLKALTYLTGRLLVNVPHVSLANILLGRRAIPEYIQGDASPEALKKAVMKLMDDENFRQQMKAAFDEAREVLGDSMASLNAADLAEEVARW